MESVVTDAWLAQRLGEPDLVIADCRFDLADPQAGQRAYDRDHIPGAVYFHLERDLSRSPREQAGEEAVPPARGTGGRHPLPSAADMATMLGNTGIDDATTVICYDEQRGSMAARLWWMLRYLGHRRVALLDGGYGAWQAAGHPVTKAMPHIIPKRFIPRVQHHMVATMAQVRAGSATGQGIIVDSRAPQRYRGEIEPLDPVAGHIPGAINVPWEDNIDDNGRLLNAVSLAERFAAAGLTPGDGDAEEVGPIIVHCGSGVTGCLNVLAMERAGVSGVKLYPGGWSEWCADLDNPVVAKK